MLKYKDYVGQDLIQLVSGTPFSIEFYEHEVRIEHKDGLGVSIMPHNVGGLDAGLRFLIDGPETEEYTGEQLGILSWMLDSARVIEGDILAANQVPAEEQNAS